MLRGSWFEVFWLFLKILLEVLKELHGVPFLFADGFSSSILILFVGCFDECIQFC